MKRRHAAAGALAIALAAGAAGAAITAGQGLPVQKEQVSAADLRLPHPTPLPARLPGETFEQYRQRVPQAAGGKPYNIAQETRGAPITVGGKTVQLPPDAYVEGMTTSVLCVPERPCPETPFYTIRRGDSWINVALRSGTILAEKTAPGEEHAFDFLKEALG